VIVRAGDPIVRDPVVSTRWLDDWSVGEFLESEPYEIDQDRIVAFAHEFDPQRFHIDPDGARETIYGGLIASGWHTASIMMRLLSTFLGDSSMGSPGVDGLRWLAPVRPGDQVRLHLLVDAVTRSTSKPDRGVVVVKMDLRNQREETVATMTAPLLMRRRPAGPGNEGAGPGNVGAGLGNEGSGTPSDPLGVPASPEVDGTGPDHEPEPSHRPRRGLLFARPITRSSFGPVAVESRLMGSSWTGPGNEGAGPGYQGESVR